MNATVNFIELKNAVISLNAGFVENLDILLIIVLVLPQKVNKEKS